MSKYTTEVRFICEHYAGVSESKGYDDIEEIIEDSRGRIFNNYPIFDELYRPVLEKKILMHYYTREICEETVGLWKLRLAARMNEIMPKYNKLYESERLAYNPLWDTDLTSTHNRSNDSVGSNVGNTERNDKGNKESEYLDNSNGNKSQTQTIDELHWQKYSDTPQGYVNNLDNDTYLTNATKNTADDTITTKEKDSQSKLGNNSSNSEVNSKEKRTDTNIVNSTEEYVERITGKRGGANYAKMIEDYRNTLLNIDLMVINELRDLFFLLW